MSDVMFFGVLEMPYEMAMSDEMSRLQFYGRVRQAIDRLKKAEADLEDAKVGLECEKESWRILNDVCSEAQNRVRELEADRDQALARADAAEAELAKLREQIPYAWVNAGIYRQQTEYATLNVGPDNPWKDGANAFPVYAAPIPAQSLAPAVPDLDAAKRLRLIANKVGLVKAIPEDDAQLWAVAFSVLGMIRHQLDRNQPIGYVIQHDANGGNFFTGTSSFAGMQKTYGSAAKLVFESPVAPAEQQDTAAPSAQPGQDDTITGDNK